MRTRTIFEAFTECAYRIGAGSWVSDADSGRAVRQLRTLRAELLRRMDERDTWDALRKTRRPKTFADAGMTTMTIYGKWDI